MKIIYFSKTGNIKRFINNLGQNLYDHQQGHEDLVVTEPILLITYTTGMGEVPSDVLNFCEKNHQYIDYVMASGNRNWGTLFAKSGDIIASKFNAELLYKFELSGNMKDLSNVNKILKEIWN